MNILYQEINKRVQDKYVVNEDSSIKELFDAWEHEAYEYKGELLYQGLEETAKEVQRIIDEQMKFKPKGNIMKLYAITRITEDHYTWMDVFGVTPNKKVADKKVQELREAGRYGEWVVQEFESNDVKNITGLEQ